MATKNATSVNVAPLADRVMVKSLEGNEQTRGGLFIPDTAKEKPQEGEILAVGPGRFEDGKRVPMELKVGDKVLFGKYSGTEVTIDGEPLLILRESDVLATLS
jgi:chaperonin GroES